MGCRQNAQVWKQGSSCFGGEKNRGNVFERKSCNQHNPRGCSQFFLATSFSTQGKETLDFTDNVGSVQGGGGGGGGGTLILSAYLGSGPASTVHPKKKFKNFKHPLKKLKFLQPKKISGFCIFTFRKDP